MKARRIIAPWPTCAHSLNRLLTYVRTIEATRNHSVVEHGRRFSAHLGRPQLQYSSLAETRDKRRQTVKVEVSLTNNVRNTFSSYPTRHPTSELLLLRSQPFEKWDSWCHGCSSSALCGPRGAGKNARFLPKTNGRRPRNVFQQCRCERNSHGVTPAELRTKKVCDIMRRSVCQRHMLTEEYCVC